MLRTLLIPLTATMMLITALGCHPRPVWQSVLHAPLDTPVTWTQIDRGIEHACGVSTEGNVLCWGSNWGGQLGNGLWDPVTMPAPVVRLDDARKVVTGGFHSCALKNNGDVFCWGLNEQQQLARDGLVLSRKPLHVKGLDGPAIDIAAGLAHSCALLETGVVRCWGLGPSGQLGNAGVQGGSTQPVEVEGLEDVDQIAAGAYHTCARQRSGAVWCWGANWGGQLGTGDYRRSRVPKRVQGLGGDVVELSLGDEHSCARMASGVLACWGSNTAGQIGDGTRDDALQPWRVIELERATHVSAGALETCAVDRSGAVVCWGQRFTAEHFIEEERRVLSLGRAVRQIATASSGSCVVFEDGTATCWGLRVPQRPLLDAPSLLAVDTGYQHSCTLTGSGEVYCWGLDNQSGQLGRPITEEDIDPTPQRVFGLGHATAVATGGGHSCALIEDGSVMCWGYGVDGQVGDGEHLSRAEPRSVQGLEHAVIRITAGDSHTCALDSVGGVWCWGWNRSGQLGDGTSESHATPVRVMDLKGVIEISAGYEHTCALTDRGELLCWGYNVAGELGDGSTTSSSRPVRVDLGRDAVAVSAGDSHTCALDRLGGVWCWGKDSLGQLGNGEAGSQPRPMRVSGLPPASQISAGSGHTCALMSDSDVRCWGLNDLGQLGDPSLHPYFLRVQPIRVNSGGDALEVVFDTPQKLLGLSGVTQVEAGYKRTCVLIGHHEVLCSGAVE